MATVIMPAGCLMAQGAFLQSLDQARRGSALSVSRPLRQREFEGTWRSFPQATQAAKRYDG
jgi:hypothetical protein